MIDDKPIVLTLDLMGGVGGVVPEGIKERLVITCRNGAATFRFNNTTYTKLFVISQLKEGMQSKYIERSQTCVTLYPNFSKEMVLKDIQESLKKRTKGVNDGQ